MWSLDYCNSWLLFGTPFTWGNGLLESSARQQISGGLSKLVWAFLLASQSRGSRHAKPYPRLGVGWDHWAGKKFAEAQILRRFPGLFGSHHTLEVKNGI